jgi:hypothetical protein
LSILYFIGGHDYFVFELKQLRKRRTTMESQFASSYGLEKHGIRNTGFIYWNLSTPLLYEEVIRRRE